MRATPKKITVPHNIAAVVWIAERELAAAKAEALKELNKHMSPGRRYEIVELYKVLVAASDLLHNQVEVCIGRMEESKAA